VLVFGVVWRTLHHMAYPFKQSPSDDWSDADRFYRNYVENCERLGIMPIPWIEAQALMVGWSTAFAAGPKTPPTFQ
jgi:hypothetical protein